MEADVPPVVTVNRRDVVAIQYVTTARPGAPRYYFVNREGSAVLWVDRFLPARMASFAAYLGVPMRPVSAAPRTAAAADAAVQANAIVGARRSAMILMAGCAVVGLLFTVGAVWWGAQSRDRLAAYERAPLCTQASADPRACRYDAPAVVTDFGTRGHIDLGFPADVPTVRVRTTWVRLANDMHRLFEAMQVALTNLDRIQEPVVIVRPVGPWGRSMKATGRLTHRLWLAWVG